MQVDRHQLFIGGEWTNPLGGGRFDVVCPSTEETIGHVPASTIEDVDRAVAAARRAFDDGEWAALAPLKRAERLAPVVRYLEDVADELARTITTEMGAPISSAAADQVAQPIATFDYYLGLAETFAFEETRTVQRSTQVVQEPVGVVAAIVPWNAPLRSIINKLAPALVAGCSVVVKPAPNTPLSAMILADAIHQAGLPEGLVSILPADRDVGAHLVGHPGVDKVAFTGSTAAGRRIMAAAADNLTRVGLELGGKSAAIVLDDADLDLTLRRLVPLAIGNTGQACTAQSRVFVSDRLHDELVDRLCAAMQDWAPGDPFDPATRTGPLASAPQLERVCGYLDLAAREGAKAAVGGGRPSGFERGYFVEPTVLVEVDNSMRVAREEIFGPVLSVLRYRDVEHAISMANDSPYGLSGSVWTRDTEQGISVARRLRTGQVRINGDAVAADAPFGGFKSSGIGREYGPEGLASFLEAKAIAFRPVS